MRKGNILMLGASAAAMMAFQPAIAQDGAQEDEIVVQGRVFRDPSDATATKLSTPIAETASQVTVYNEDFLDSIGITNFVDAVNYVPGVSSYASGFEGAYFFVARGFGVSERNGIRINGAPIGDDFFFDNIALERLEYVKGAQAAAYGEVSAGGFINVALKEGSSEELGGTAQLRYDSFNTVRSELTYGGPLNESGSLRGLIGWAGEQSDEYYDDGDSKSQAVFGTISYDWTDRFTTSLNAYYDDRSSKINSGLPIGEDLTDPANPVYSVVSYDKNLFAAGTHGNQSSNFFFIQGLASFEVNDRNTITASYSLVDANQEREDQEPAAFDYGQFVDLTPNLPGGAVNPNFGNVGLDSFAFDKLVETTYAEIRWTGDVDLGQNAVLNYVFGGEYYNFERKFIDYTIGAGDTTLNVFNPDRSGPNPFSNKTFDEDFAQENEVYSLSALFGLDLYERLRLNAGIRYDDREGRENTTDAANTEAFPVENTVYSASVVYDVLENVHLYYAYGQGIEYNTSVTCNGVPLDPEENESHEIGAKWEVSSTLIAGVAIFDNSSQNAPNEVEQCPAGSIFTTGNVSSDSDQFGEGVEFELIGSITPAWNISAGFSYIDDGVGDSPFVTPETTATLFTTYDFLDGPYEGLGFGIGFRYEAERPVEGGVDVPATAADVMGFDPETSNSRFISFPDAIEDGLGDYFTIDAAVYYQLTDNVDIAVNIQNLNDEEYYSSFGDPFFNLIRQPPRNVAFTINIDF